MARLLLGQHPHGPVGLFISKPGVAVENTSPNDTNNLLFSSQWGNIVNIIASGSAGLGETVTLPNVGYRPYVLIESQVGQSYNYGSAAEWNVSSGIDIRNYAWTRYKLSYLSDNSFQIARSRPTVDPGGNDVPGFRYLALNFPVNQ